MKSDDVVSVAQALKKAPRFPFPPGKQGSVSVGTLLVCMHVSGASRKMGERVRGSSMVTEAWYNHSLLEAGAQLWSAV